MRASPDQITVADAHTGQCQPTVPVAGLVTALRVAQLRPALVNRTAGVVVTVRGRPVTVMGFTVADGKTAGIDATADPDRVRRITATVHTDE